MTISLKTPPTGLFTGPVTRRPHPPEDAAATALTRVHLKEFPESRHETVALPAPLSEAEYVRLREAAVHEATRRLSFFDRAGRRAVTRNAVARVDQRAHREYIAAVIRAQRRQIDLDDAWDAIEQHDPKAVVARVDQAFAATSSDRTCVDAGYEQVDRSYHITCVVVFGSAAMIPEAPLHPRTATERNELYARALASTVLATAKQGLAVAVGADEARILVLRQDPRSRTPGLIYAGRIIRDLVYSHADPVTTVLSAPDAQLRRTGASREVADLPIGDDPGLRRLLDDVASRLL